MLYSLETSHNGFNHIGYLNQSYALGPHEGWISLRRNRLALASFLILSEPAQAAVISEFVGMVDSAFTEEAAMNLASIGQDQRSLMLASLEHAEIASRETFAKTLARAGINVSVPGVTLDGRWFR